MLKSLTLPELKAIFMKWVAVSAKGQEGIHETLWNTFYASLREAGKIEQG